MKKQTTYTYKTITKLTPQLSTFSDKVWKIADMHRYGRKIDWEKETRVIQAYEDKKLVGLLELTLEAGVMHILDLVVDYAYQRLDIGTTLMQQAETLAKQEKVHKIFLETGKEWEVREFYEKLGYVKTGDLPNHFAKEDYVEYTKFI